MSISATLQACLHDKGCQYELVRHPHTFNSMETAEAAHIPGDRLAKTVLLEDRLGYVAAVLPSTHHLRLGELWLQTGRHLVLAREPDLRTLFQDCDVGAIPPVCPAYGMPTFLEESLTRQPDVYFEAGNHEELVHMSTSQFLDLMDQAEQAHFSRRAHRLSH